MYGDEFEPGNEIVLTVWWYDPSVPPNTQFSLMVTVTTTNIEGQCSNSGEYMLEDYAIEDVRNMGIGGLPPMRDWGFSVSDDLDYDGLETLITESRPLYSGEQLTLRITSYDWMGFCTITVTGDPGTAMHECPLDAEGDYIPDARESAQQVQGKPDDQDRDSRATPVHLQRGDGLPAGLEKRGIKRFGTVQMTENMPDTAGSNTYGGANIKDVFINYPGIELDPGPMFFPNPNPYIYDHGIVWHYIKTDETEPGGAGLARWMIDTGGPVRRVQRTILIRDRTPIIDPISKVRRLGESNKSVSSGVPVDLDTGYIQDQATAAEIEYTALLGWTVAHEIGHKLSLPHNESERTYEGDMPNPEPAPSLTKYYTTGPDSNIAFWTRSLGSGANTKTLELLSRLENAGNNKIITNTGAVTAAPGTLTEHNVQHSYGRYAAVLNGAVQQANPLTLIIETHLGNLMDPILRPAELDGVSEDPLPSNLEPLIMILN